MIKDKTIVISAAGTMGHINPGLSFAFLLKKYSPNIKIIFLTQKKNTNQIIRHDYFCYIDSLFTVEATGISRKALLKNLKLIKDSFKILDKIKKLYKDHNVNLVLGMGGYLSGYATYAAKQLKIPYIIHEQNIVMGLANKLSKKKAERVLVSFPKKGKNVVMVGNPRLLLARSVLKDKKLKMKNHILVLSGSLGASFINNLLIDFLKTSESHEYFTTLVTGKRYYDDTVKKLSEIAGEHYRVLPYLDNPLKYMKENMDMKILSYKGKVFAVEPPMFVELEVTYTEPGFSGNTTTTSGKPAKLENGLEISVPLFVEIGDKIKIKVIYANKQLRRINFKAI